MPQNDRGAPEDAPRVRFLDGERHENSTQYQSLPSLLTGAINGLVWVADHRPRALRSTGLLREAAATLCDARTAILREVRL
jgi:hypothetical protein